LRAAGCVYAEDEARMLIDTASSPDELESLVERRVAGEPLEVIVGWASFCGLRIVVEAGVFVPRRRTELLVEEADALVTPGMVVVDMCCGSGAVAAALLARRPGLEVYAADIEPAAVRCARANLGSRGTVFEGDLFDPLPESLRGRVDVVVANAPYVPTDAISLMPPEARIHEPQVALDGGADGLDLQRRVAVAAPAWLRPRGRLLIETSERQAPATVLAFEEAGFAASILRSEELDGTVVVGTLLG
jgi:release factor glutamine methyltransferase